MRLSLLLSSAALLFAALSQPPATANPRKHPAPAEKSMPLPHPNPQLADPALNARVDQLLSRMTLAEKVGQLAQYSAGTPTGPGTGREDYADMVAKGQVGSLLNVTSAAAANRYQRIAVEKSRLHIPLLFGYDVIHGDRTTFPVPLALAASFNPDLVQQTARMAAAEARADGVNWVFSPMVDIARDARWGRIVESAGESPALGNALAAAYIRGYQQNDLGKPDSVAACVKHFAAYGAPIAGRDYNAVDMSEITLRQTYLPPYRAAVDAGAASVMSSFNSLNGVPATANPFLLTQILRHEWGFDGPVVSDWGAIGELLHHGVAADGPEAARKAITAGVDMDMESDLYRTRLVALVQTGKLPESVVDQAVRRILRLKFALGLFDHPYAPDNAPAYHAGAAQRELARSAAEQSFVLLKNDPIAGPGRLLPIPKSARTIALIGPLADSPSDMLGSWAASGNPRDAITLRQALSDRLGGKLLYAKGTEILTQSTTGFQPALDAARKADLVVLALGESGPGMTGEASSRTRLGLPGNQQQLLEAVAATGRPVILVLFNGRPLAIPWAAEHIPAILEAWFPGIEAGPALVRTLFGDANPSGRLPVSFPYDAGQEPLYLAQLPTGRPAGDADLSHPPQNAAERYLSRYLDAPNAPVFPFGWGLSYTQFTYSPLEVTRTRASSTQVGEIHVALAVRNTGPLVGTDIVQLYLRDKVASVEQPVRELKAFQRLTLAPGEQRRIEFTLRRADLAFYNTQHQPVVEPGEFDVWVGGSSKATNHATFRVLE
jgi:beta-glucosidase